MDVARPPRSKTGRNVAIGAGVIALVAIGIVISRLPKAAPTIDLAVVIQDSVRMGDMVRDVHGPGNLVPEQIRWIPAQASARVDRLVAQAGQTVEEGAVLLELSNPDVEIQTMQADQALSQARGALVDLKTNLTSSRLTQEGLVASTHTQYVAATQDATAAEALLKQNVGIAVFDVNNKRALADEMTTRYRIEQQRLNLMIATADSQIAVQQSNVDRLKSIAEFQHNILKSLIVRAPQSGVVQDLTLQQGQWVTSGTTLAKIVQPGKLKAVLRIAEAQAADVLIGQTAIIDTRSTGTIVGHVSRKDPSAVAGTVVVDVALDAALPAGAVPDLSVDGTIQIEKLNKVLYTGRPSYGAGTGMVGLFKIVDGGSAAERVQVLLGRSSVTSVEIVRGLNVGDKVILSDMSQWDNVDRVRLK